MTTRIEALAEARRVGLVLGRAAPAGHAYHAGLLCALQLHAGWDARAAEIVLGTSAGAQVGALLRAGVGAEDLMARVVGEPLSDGGAAVCRHYTRPDHRVADPARPRRLRPAAPGWLLHAARRPWHARPGHAIAALLPEGRADLGPQADGFRAIFGGRWPEQRLWIPAIHMPSGRRVVFGRDGAPSTDVGTAVLCSGAVPGVWTPGRVDADRYVDGGIVSATHLDLMLHEGLDLVVVSSPLSRFPALRMLLRREVTRLRRHGLRVLVFEPAPEVARTIGWNPMDPVRGPAIARMSLRAAQRRIEAALALAPVDDALSGAPGPSARSSGDNADPARTSRS